MIRSERPRFNVNRKIVQSKKKFLDMVGQIWAIFDCVVVCVSAFMLDEDSGIKKSCNGSMFSERVAETK